MGEAREPRHVNLICAVLAGRREWLAAAKERLERAFGQVDAESDVWPFEATDYYEAEMGPGLLRAIYGFRELIAPDALAEIKLETNRLEGELVGALSAAPTRPVNVDPGYVSLGKLVLATTKDHAHRVYLRGGIYAEATLCWRNGRFVPWDWTYPDYRTGHYRAFFAQVRRLYRAKLRERRSADPRRAD